MNKIFLGFVILLLTLFSVTPPVRAASQPEVGVATGNTLLFISDEDLQRRLADIKNLGATWIRVDFNWNTVQVKDGSTFDWRYQDRVVDAAAKQGIKVLPMIGYTPKWARNAKCVALVPDDAGQQKCTPRDTAEFARFAKKTAEHFAPKGIHAWEIWNEPNIKGFWRWVGPSGKMEIDPHSYARLANATGMAIHEADPTATVITGGLAPVYDPRDTSGMRQNDYVRKIAPLLNPDAIDGIGMHPYTQPALPREYENWNAFYTIDGGTDEYNLRKILDTAGRQKFTIWATEFGASTVGQHSACNDPTDRKDITKRFDHVTEAMQATIIRQGIEDWFKKDRVGPILLHAESDQWLAQHANEGGFGLRRKDGTAKPGYEAYQQGIQSARAAAASY